MAVERISPDICVIGGGAAGLAAATTAAALGAATVLVERAAMGGDSLAAGPLPLQALQAAARRAAWLRGADAFGVHAGDVQVRFAAVMEHVRAVCAAAAPAVSAERLAGLGIRVVAGDARFTDRRTVAVGEALEIRARRFVVATGAAPAIPSIPGLDEGPYLTRHSVFRLKELPADLIVLGAGPVALTLAQAFRRLGSRVTVLADGPPLPGYDPEAAAIVLAQLEHEGVAVRTDMSVLRIGHAIGHLGVTIRTSNSEEHVGGTHLLIAGDDRPVIEGLGLAAAGIGHEPLGIAVAGIGHEPLGIAVDRPHRTSNRRVYAVGSVAAGPFREAQAGVHHAGLAVRDALGRPRPAADPMPRVVLTEPELAQTGLTEAEARARRLKFRILRSPYQENDRALADGVPHGHVKVLADRQGRILGVSIVGAQAGELITAWSLAIAQKLSFRTFTDLVVPYPTLAEIGKKVALGAETPGLTRPLLRRIIRVFRIFG